MPEYNDLQIRNCVFAFKCKTDWDYLPDTEDPKIRFCNECTREVHLCKTDKDLVNAVKRNHCVAILSPYTGSMVMGDIAPPERRKKTTTPS